MPGQNNQLRPSERIQIAGLADFRAAATVAKNRNEPVILKMQLRIAAKEHRPRCSGRRPRAAKQANHRPWFAQDARYRHFRQAIAVQVAVKVISIA